MKPTPLLRSALSVVPSHSLLRARGIVQTIARRRGTVHEDDFRAFERFNLSSLTVVDVGANRGQAIDSFFGVLGTDTTIVAFEPNLELAAYLAKRYRRHRVDVHECGLADDVGSMRLYLPRYGRTVWDTRASLDLAVAQNALSPDEFWRYSERRAGVEEHIVAIARLDDFDLAPQILKIDVEGREDAVVRGGTQTIERYLPVILAEGSLLADLELLRDLGYRPYRYDSERNQLSHGVGSLNTFMLAPEHRTWFAVPVDG